MGFLHRLACQFRQPRGLSGRLVGYAMRRANRPGMDWTLGLMQVGPGDRILEIGYGPGEMVRRLARAAPSGFIAGVDHSGTMHRVATKRNSDAVREGRVDLRLGDAAALPFPDGSFDKVVAANVLYFWKDPAACLQEILRVLRPGGRLFLYFADRSTLEKIPFAKTGVYRFYGGADAVLLLEGAGFSTAGLHSRDIHPRAGMPCNVAVGEKPTSPVT